MRLSLLLRLGHSPRVPAFETRAWTWRAPDMTPAARLLPRLLMAFSCLVTSSRERYLSGPIAARPGLPPERSFRTPRARAISGSRHEKHSPTLQQRLFDCSAPSPSKITRKRSVRLSWLSFLSVGFYRPIAGERHLAGRLRRRRSSSPRGPTLRDANGPLTRIGYASVASRLVPRRD